MKREKAMGAALKPSALTLEPLWQTESDNLKNAASEFSRFHWASPRAMRDFAAHSDGTATFSVANGVRTYVAEFKRGTFGSLVVVSYVRNGDAK
jgi:hypothetical protein